MKLAEDQEQEIEEIKGRLEELLLAGGALLLVVPISIHVGIYKLVMLIDKRWQRLLGMNYPPAEMY